LLILLADVEFYWITSHTHSPSRLSCRPTQQQARSKSIRHACVSMSHDLRTCLQVSYGPMIARAFCVGTDTSPAWEEAVPIGVIELGTSASQPSSCCESVGPLSVYHEPA
jgi:hypothetical protein